MCAEAVKRPFTSVGVISTVSLFAKNCDPDEMSRSPVLHLDVERRASGVDPDALSVALFDSAQAVTDRQRIAALWFDDHVVRGLPKLAAPFLSRTGAVERGLRLARRMVELRTIHGLSGDEFGLLQSIAFEQSPLAVHDTVFVPALQHLASPEQQGTDDVLSRARAWAISGSFAQTELGHGSAVRGIETTATFLPDEDAFRLDTPGPSAAKWWVGGLGFTASHAVIMAQLVLDDGTRRGVHPFLVRIREPDGDGGWRLVADVRAGEIGPKFGLSTVDNGWARFSGLRAPRAALLAATGRVEREQGSDGRWRGVYVAANGAEAGRAAYRSLVAARVIIVQIAHVAASHGVTIAIRYAAGRAQFPPPGSAPGSAETLLLDYPSHQRRLMPVLAAAYALTATADATPALLDSAAAAAGTAAAKAIHILSSSLKVFVTECVSAGLEECRRACGGQGYSLGSGLPQLYATFVHMCTAEGDNTVLCQQVAKGLLSAGAPPGLDAATLIAEFESAIEAGGCIESWEATQRLLEVCEAGEGSSFSVRLQRAPLSPPPGCCCARPHRRPLISLPSRCRAPHDGRNHGPRSRCRPPRLRRRRRGAAWRHAGS